RALGPALQALRQRAAPEDRPPAERDLLRAVLHRLRVRRDPDLPAVGPLRERRGVVVRRLPPRRRRLVERDPRDAAGRRARGGAGEAPRRQRAAHVRHRGDALRDRGAAAARAPGLVPRRRGINRQACWRPGMTPEQIGQLDPDQRHPITPGAQDPTARLRDMDTMGIERALLFPTLFAEHFPLVENPDAAWALARAYNDWLWDFAGADRRRLVPVALLPMQEPSFAVRELERAA